MAFGNVIRREMLLRLTENTLGSGPAGPWGYSAECHSGMQASSTHRCQRLLLQGLGRRAGAGGPQPAPLSACVWTQPLNHRTVRAGRQGHLQQVTRERVQVGSECLRSAECTPPRAGLSVLCHPQREQVLPHAEVKLLVSVYGH